MGGKTSPSLGGASNRLSPPPHRKSSLEKQSSGSSKQTLQVDKIKVDNDFSSRSVGSPRSCENMYSHEASKGATERAKSQFLSSSQHSQKRQFAVQKGSQSAELSRQNNSSGSAAGHKEGSGLGVSQFDKISNSSSEHLLGVMGEDDLAKDLGVFDIEFVGLKPPSNSQNTKSFAVRSSPTQPLSQKNLQGHERRLYPKI